MKHGFPERIEETEAWAAVTQYVGEHGWGGAQAEALEERVIDHYLTPWDADLVELHDRITLAAELT